MDFFVSYTSVDRAWAEWIAWQLESEGYQVVVQAWDFSPGSDWAHDMQRATSTAARVVAVLSPDYLRSDHGEARVPARSVIYKGASFLGLITDRICAGHVMVS